jgi:hypothetical protein
MASIDAVNPVAAAGLAFVVQPWVLVAAGVSTIADAKLSNRSNTSGSSPSVSGARPAT